MTFEVREAEDADTEAIVALQSEADDARVVSAESARYLRRTRRPREHLLELVAVDAGRVVAWGAAGLNTWTSIPGAGWAFVTVTSDRRREGIGSALGAALLEHARGLGMTKLTSFVRHTEEGERWASARGWSRAITGPLIAVDPRGTPHPELPEGFRCVPLSDLAASDVYEAMCEAARDEPSPTPNDRIAPEEFQREWDDPVFDLGCSAAVVGPDGRVAAFTFIKVAGDRGEHGFTGTARALRGRGLATAAKRFALRAAAARGVTRVTTSNAEENEAMRAVNRRLGFEPVGEHVILQHDLAGPTSER